MAKEGEQLRIGHVVRDLARHDEVERPGLVGVVAGAIVDCKVGRRCVAGGLDAFLVQVDADQLCLKSPLASPASDRTQHVAVAEADIEQPKVPGIAHRALEKGQRRPGGEGEAIDPGEIVQHSFVDGRIEVRSVHLLVLARADIELAHGSS